MTVISLDKFQAIFDALPVASALSFRRVVTEGRLKYADADGSPDYVDEMSARLICSALSVGVPTLVVFPDVIERRSPLLFSAALIMDAVGRPGKEIGSQNVLYVSSHSGIRKQLASVRVGALVLDTVFAQRYGSGRVEELHSISPHALRAVSVPEGNKLPTVLCIYAPADPGSLLTHCKPLWIAVDCGDAYEIGWLQLLLVEAQRMKIPIVGWTGRPFTGAVDTWMETGGGVFRWPRLRRDAGRRIRSLEELTAAVIDVEVVPRILIGEDVEELSATFAAAAEAFVRAHDFQNGRFSRDAVALGWRYLRALESLPVPPDLHDAEANSYWGVRRLSELRSVFLRFVDQAPPKLHDVLREAGDALTDAHRKLERIEPPLWCGLTNLCVEAGGERQVVFSSRAKKEMFSFSLLARFNISEEDLREIGVRLTYLSADGVGDLKLEAGICDQPDNAAVPTYVGFPSHHAERRFDKLMQSDRVEILLWPHHLPLFERRVKHLASGLTLSSTGLARLLPTLEEPTTSASTSFRSVKQPIRLGPSRHLTARASDDELKRGVQTTALWKQPNATDVIADLFGSVTSADDEEAGRPIPLVDEQIPESGGSGQSQDELWVEEALQILFESGWNMLLATDETLNVLVRKATGIEVEQRYARSLRQGDEILFIQGQRRQSLYDLLVSRVHRNPSIAQYLALIRRWQEDFVKSYTEAERRRVMSADTLLRELQRKGSRLISAQTVRFWLRSLVLAPHDMEDLRRVADILSMNFVITYYKQIYKAAQRLRGLHISLSARLNRWLTSNEAGSASTGEGDEVVDAELGLTLRDFQHSLLRLRVLDVIRQRGPFYRPHLGCLEGGKT